MHTRAPCRHELRRRPVSRSGGGTLNPYPPGREVTQPPLHDKDRSFPLHSLCKVKQFPGGENPSPLGATDCGTKFDLRSMPVLLNPEESSETASMRPPRPQMPPTLSGGNRKLQQGGHMMEGERYFHEKWSGWKVPLPSLLGEGKRNCYACVLYGLRGEAPLPLRGWGGWGLRAVSKEYRTYIRIRNPRRAISCL